MPAPWIAEVDITPDLARRLIGSQFPDLRVDRIELFGEGWDNTACLINGETVFRFPRRQQAVGLMETECRVLPSISPRLPLPVPVPIFQGRPSELFPWPFAGYRLIHGEPACSSGLTDSERMGLAEPLGLFLRALHAIGAKEAARFGAGPDSIARLDFARRLPRALELLSRHADSLDIDPSVFEAILRDPEVHVYEPRNVSLIHGDLYCRHLLIDETRTLAGVIDWGDVHIGDPAADLMIAYTMLAGRARERFFAAYGDVPPITRKIARCRGVYHSLYVLDYARTIDDHALEAECRIGFRNLAAV